MMMRWLLLRMSLRMSDGRYDVTVSRMYKQKCMMRLTTQVSKGSPRLHQDVDAHWSGCLQHHTFDDCCATS